MTERYLQGPGPRPLRVLITRPDEQGEETAQLVREAGGEPVLHPCLRVQPPPDPAALSQAVRALGTYTAVAVASVNAARALLDALQREGLAPAVALSSVLVAAVGPRTAEALASAGVRVDVVPPRDGTAEALADALQAAARAGRLGARPRLLLPRAAEGREHLMDVLPARGIEVVAVTAYQMSEPAAAELAPMVAALTAGAIDLVPVGSPRTVRTLAGAIGAAAPAVLAQARVGAIGPTTAAALRELGIRTDVVAPEPTFASLLRALAGASGRAGADGER